MTPGPYHLQHIDPRRAEYYAPPAMEQIPRLLSAWDRECFSLTCGSFDRDHWAWKFRDFPLTMAQVALYPVALVWRLPFPNNPYFQNSEVLQWLIGGVQNTCRRQHRNGAFDSVGPYTQDHGVTLAMVYALTEVHRLLGESLPADDGRLITRTVERAVEFALHSSEDYAFITNHQALFALALLNAHQLTGDIRFSVKAQDIIHSILKHQSPEGWYQEYQGTDPGYESLGLYYLATYWQRTRDRDLLQSLRRSVDFYAHWVHPDGSIGGGYGSRHTALYFPGGFEILAPEVPMAESVACFMRHRFHTGNVVTPALTDQENLPVLVYAYLQACLDWGEAGRKSSPLPLESLDGLRHFPHAGLLAVGNRNYYAVANLRQGGTCRIFGKTPAELVFEDAGYVLLAGRSRYTSQAPGSEPLLSDERPQTVVIETHVAEIRQEVLTPIKFLVLRLLNLTAFRHIGLGAWIRRKVIDRLILQRRNQGPAQLTRSITFSEDAISFKDRLILTTSVAIDSVRIARRFTPIHMGSAKYFHTSDLKSLKLPETNSMATDLNRDRSTRRDFVVRLSGDDNTCTTTNILEHSHHRDSEP